MGVNDIKRSNSLNVFPNPVSSEFNIGFNAGHAGPVTIKIIDAVGKIIGVREAHLVEGENKLIINNLEGLKPGIYVVILDSDSFHSSAQFVKLPD